MSPVDTEKFNARAAELEAMKRPELNEEATKANLTVPAGTKNADLVQLLLKAEFGPREGPASAEGTDGASGTSDAAAATQEGTADKSEDSVDALSEQHNEIGLRLDALYNKLVEQIKATNVEGISVETAEQQHAGAVQFLGQCNAVLAQARQFVEDGRKVCEENNRQLSEIAKAKVSLEQRSQEYCRLTGKGQA